MVSPNVSDGNEATAVTKENPLTSTYGKQDGAGKCKPRTLSEMGEILMNSSWLVLYAHWKLAFRWWTNKYMVESRFKNMNKHFEEKSEE